MNSMENQQEGRKMFSSGLALGFILSGIFFMVITFIVTNRVVDDERRKAIEAGVGRWIVDHKTGDRTFKYGNKKDE